MSGEFSLADANRIARSIEDSITTYAKRIDVDRVGVTSFGTDIYQPGTPGLMRASEFSSSKCPKLAAVKAWGLAPRVIAPDLEYRFLIARYAAMAAKVGVAEYLDPALYTSILAETNSVRQGMACTSDLIISVAEESGEVLKLPVEIKYTVGLQEYAVEQCIANMWVLDAPYGYVLALYTGWRKTRKVWTVVRTTQGWAVYYGIVPADSEEFREGAENRVRVQYDQAWFEQVYEARLTWQRRLDVSYPANNLAEFMDGAGPYANPFARPCADEVIPVEYYKKSGKWGGKGDRKRESGYVTGLCPLWGHCHHWALEGTGISPEPLPGLLEIEGDKDAIKIKPLFEDSDQSADFT